MSTQYNNKITTPSGVACGGVSGIFMCWFWLWILFSNVRCSRCVRSRALARFFGFSRVSEQATHAAQAVNRKPNCERD
jgi:hypothetical protein